MLAKGSQHNDQRAGVARVWTPVAPSEYEDDLARWWRRMDQADQHGRWWWESKEIHDQEGCLLVCDLLEAMFCSLDAALNLQKDLSILGNDMNHAF